MLLVFAAAEGMTVSFFLTGDAGVLVDEFHRW
jgi:hypothetical protein